MLQRTEPDQMSDRKAEIETVLRRIDETLQTAQHGLDDLLDSSRTRRMSGLRNLIVFGRSVTFVLQNLRSVVPDFDRWYEPQQQALKDDPLMRYFVEARNELEKQGKLSIATSVQIKSFSTDDIKKFGPPPFGATSFFIGDQLGGTGWDVALPDGTKEKYYVELSDSIGHVKQRFSNFPEAKAPELQGCSVEELSQMFIDRLRALVHAAQAHFLGTPQREPQTKQRPSHLRVVK
jgi:hypothetical protein